jgi:hypothetical protein
LSQQAVGMQLLAGFVGYAFEDYPGLIILNKTLFTGQE